MGISLVGVAKVVVPGAILPFDPESTRRTGRQTEGRRLAEYGHGREVGAARSLRKAAQLLLWDMFAKFGIFVDILKAHQINNPEI